MSKGWIGVDLDGTLIKYDGEAFSPPHVGEPVVLMVERVKGWLAAYIEVKIFTARVASTPQTVRERLWHDSALGRPLRSGGGKHGKNKHCIRQINIEYKKGDPSVFDDGRISLFTLYVINWICIMAERLSSY